MSAGLLLLPPLLPALGVLLAIGVVPGTGTPLYQTVRQERTPQKLRGRVFSTVAAAEAMAIPPVVLLAGFVVGLFGLQAALVGFVAGNTLYGILKLAIPGGREIGSNPRPVTSLR